MRLYPALILAALVAGIKTTAQENVTLTLERAIVIAADSSLAASVSQNTYLASYWQYRAYKAARLPSVALNLTPAQYYRDITRRYDSEQNIDVYRAQQWYYADGGLSVTQNFDLLGGSFFLNSNLSYMRNFGDNTSTQFTSVPVQIGYSQSLLGYNPFKWDKKIEPLKYETAKRQLAYDLEGVSYQATTYFFDLALAQTEYDMAVQNLASADTLYRVGQERQKIAAITQAELLTLRLDAINARNSLKNAEISLQQSMYALAAYLNFDRNTKLRVILPTHPLHRELSADKALVYARENNPTLMDLQRRVLAAEQTVDQAKKQSMFDASFNASVGFNQVANTFGNVYANPSQQSMVSVSVSIPLLDWGVRKGKLNTARSNLNVSRSTAQQQTITLEQEVITTVANFNVQQDIILSAEEALDLGERAYAETRQRFIIGKADISSLTLSQQRWQEAQRNYVQALRNYRLSYYKVRQLTLFDFELNVPLMREM